ncbi:hypothetical protein [Sporisorium scitamineum]|uniref:Myb-like domain-containing protein n=1 Tax=Sporisorium scitamineum TaxID=49012 RepID=A0A0F7S8D1_9BASI|nr:hypothetical protein [Sporisorium scitamineum]
MAKKGLLKDQYDSYDELTDQDVKSPKRAKKEFNHDDSSPDTKTKRSRTAQTVSLVRGSGEATKDEDEAFMDCVADLVTAGLSQAIKQYPGLASRNISGCIQHWNSWRRKLETNLLGAPTIDGNGKKLPKAKLDVAKQGTVERE